MSAITRNIQINGGDDVNWIFGGAAVINTIAALLVYRQYLKLAFESMDFAALLISSIEKAEDKTISVNPLSGSNINGSYQPVIRAA